MSAAANDSDRLLTRPLGALAWTFAMPLGLATAFHGLFNCVDLVVVARLGSGAVGAVTVAGIINMAAMLLWNGVATSIGARACLAAGAADPRGLAEVERAARRLTWAASVVLGLGFYLPTRTARALDGRQRRDRERRARLPRDHVARRADDVLSDDGRGLTARPRRREMADGRARDRQRFEHSPQYLDGLRRPGMSALGVAGAAWATVLARFVGCGIVFVGLRRVLRARSPSPVPETDPARVRAIERAVVREGLLSAAQFLVRVIGMYVLLWLATRAFEGAADRAERARDLLDGVGLCIPASKRSSRSSRSVFRSAAGAVVDKISAGARFCVLMRRGASSRSSPPRSRRRSPRSFG